MQHLAIAQDYSLLPSTPIVLNTLTISMGILKVMGVMRPRPHPRKLRSQRRFGVRWGGEEFVLLLPRTPLDTALRWLKLSV